MKRGLLILALLALLPMSADAATISFTGDDFSGLNGHHSKTTQGITFTASPDLTLLTQSSEGIGVNTVLAVDDAGEIEWWEMLKLEFASPVSLTGFSVANLFYEYYYDIFGRRHWYQEYGAFSINGGAWTSFPGNGATTNGAYAVTFGATEVSTLQFAAKHDSNALVSHDYSVTGIALVDPEPEPDPVPEPASMLLLGSGLVGLASAVRRRRK